MRNSEKDILIREIRRITENMELFCHERCREDGTLSRETVNQLLEMFIRNFNIAWGVAHYPNLLDGPADDENIWGNG